MVVLINLKDCSQNLKTVKNEILSTVDQFFVEPKKVELKSMDGQMINKKLVCNNCSFFVDYQSTFGSIPINELGNLLRKIYCREVDIYQLGL